MRRPASLRFTLLPDPAHNATRHLDGPGDCWPTHGKTACDFGNWRVLIAKLEQLIEQTQ